MKKIVSAILVVLIICTVCITAFAADIPSKYSAVEKGYVTSVKQQGAFGTCAAFAAISCIESDYIMKGYGTKDNTDFSEAYLFWFAANNGWDDENSDYYGDGVINSVDVYSNLGANDADLFSALKTDTGIAYEYDFPYSEYTVSRMGGYTDAQRIASGCNVRIKDIVELDITDKSDIKSWILSHGSAAVSFNGTRFYEGTNGTVARNPLPLVNNHEATIVGWDDEFIAEGSFSSLVMREKGAWLCKNSWGEQWGDNGYFWLPYSDPTISSVMGFSVAVNNDCTNKHSYNGYANVFLTKVTKSANLFAAEQSGKIDKVAFLVDEDTDIKVNIYTDKGNGVPDSGKLLGSYSGHFDDMGYYTVSLSNPASVKKGDRFYAVAECPNGCMLEGRGYTYAAKKQSFVFLNGKWTDVTETRDANNLPLDIIITGVHSYGANQHKDPTCDTVGYDMKVCEHCGKVLRTNIPAKGHSFSEWEKINTISGGITVYSRTCSVCDEEERQYKDINGNIISMEEAEKVFTQNNLFAFFYDNIISGYSTTVALLSDILRTILYRISYFLPIFIRI